MTSQPGKQLITIDISPNILRNKANQTMKFGQSISITQEKFLWKSKHKIWCRN